MKTTQKQVAYGLEASPPFVVNFVLAYQHVLVAIVDLTIPLLVIMAIGGSPDQAAWVVQMLMVAIARDGGGDDLYRFSSDDDGLGVFP